MKNKLEGTHIEYKIIYNRMRQTEKELDKQVRTLTRVHIMLQTLKRSTPFYDEELTDTKSYIDKIIEVIDSNE